MMGTNKFQLQWRDIFCRFMVNNQDVCLATEKRYKIRRKYLITVNEITLSLTEIPSSPGWHMKDNWHRYLLTKVNFVDGKYNLGTRLDQIRLSCFVTQSDCRFELFPPVKFALTCLRGLISMTYEHPLWPLALKNPTAVPLAQAGGESGFSSLLTSLQRSFIPFLIIQT